MSMLTRSVQVFLLACHLTSLSMASYLDDPDLACKRTVSLGLTAQKSPSPYEALIFQRLDVAPGDTGTDIILLAPLSSPPFIGFIVEVFYKGGDPTDVGRFNANNSDSTAQVHDCAGQLSNVMTHKDLSLKRRVKLEWIAPLNGEYLPVVTFFQSGDIYWVNQTAAGKQTIKVTSSGAKRYLPWTPMEIPQVEETSLNNTNLNEPAVEPQIILE